MLPSSLIGLVSFLVAFEGQRLPSVLQSISTHASGGAQAMARTRAAWLWLLGVAYTAGAPTPRCGPTPQKDKMVVVVPPPKQSTGGTGTDLGEGTLAAGDGEVDPGTPSGPAADPPYFTWRDCAYARAPVRVHVSTRARAWAPARA